MHNNKKLIKPVPPRGMKDHLPDELMPRLKLVERIRRIFELYGFQPLETPAMERLEVLMGKYGDEGDKLIFKVMKRGEELRRALEEADHTDLADLGLRYDLTVSLARVVAQYGDKLPKPFKRYQIGPVWRADRPQRGRYREFIQCDVDIVGTGSLLADAEIISLLIDVYKDLKLPDFNVLVNHRGLLKALNLACGNHPEKFSDFCVALDKLDKIGRDGIEEEFKRRCLSYVGIDTLWDFANRKSYINDLRNHVPLMNAVLRFVGDDATGKKSYVQLHDLFQLLLKLGVPPNVVKFNPCLARGLDYYTGPVFEVFCKDKSIGSIGGGGRYDELIGMFSKESYPATGFSIGLERIVDVLMEKKLLASKESALDVEIIDLVNNDQSAVYCGSILRFLRKKGVSCDLNYDRGKKTGKQIKSADRRKVPFVLIAGEGEVETGLPRINSGIAEIDMQVTVKRLSDGVQKELRLSGLVEWIRS